MDISVQRIGMYKRFLRFYFHHQLRNYGQFEFLKWCGNKITSWCEVSYHIDALKFEELIEINCLSLGYWNKEFWNNLYSPSVKPSTELTLNFLKGHKTVKFAWSLIVFSTTFTIKFATTPCDNLQTSVVDLKIKLL